MRERKRRLYRSHPKEVRSQAKKSYVQRTFLLHENNLEGCTWTAALIVLVSEKLVAAFAKPMHTVAPGFYGTALS
jgi:hypothetical protein